MPRRVAVDLDLVSKGVLSRSHRPLPHRTLSKRGPHREDAETPVDAEVYHTISSAVHGAAAPLTRAVVHSGAALLLAAALSSLILSHIRPLHSLRIPSLFALWCTAIFACAWFLSGIAFPTTVSPLLGGGHTSDVLTRIWLFSCAFSAAWAVIASLAKHAPPTFRPLPWASAVTLFSLVVCLTAPQATLFLIAASGLAALEPASAGWRDSAATLLFRLAEELRRKPRRRQAWDHETPGFEWRGGEIEQSYDEGTESSRPQWGVPVDEAPDDAA